MIPYIIFVLLILIFRSKKSPLLMYLTMVFFSVLRYDTGWDYMSYWDEVIEWGSIGSNFARYSLPWQWLFETAQKWNMPHLAIAVPGFITLTLVYFAVSKIQKNRQDICDSLTVYALWPFFFLGTFSTIRQSLAMAIGLVILYCALNRKLFWFILLVILNVFIHTSSIVCLFFAAFFVKDFKLTIGQSLLVLAIALAGMWSVDYFINNITILNVYAVYMEENDSFGSKLSVLLSVILIPTLMIRKSKGINQGMADVCILALMLTIFTFVFMSKSILARIADYYVILLIFVAPYFRNLFRDKTAGSALIVAAFVGVFFVYLIITAGASQQGLATSPFVPYKFILFQ